MRKFLTVAVIAVALTGCASQTPTETPVTPSRTVEAPVKVELAPAIITASPTATPAPVEDAPVYQAPLDTITAPAPVYVAPKAPVQPIAAPVAPVAPVETAQPVAVAPAPVCMEDDPCFNCETMGNKICGPVTEPAPPAPEVPSIPPYTDTLPIIPPHAEPNPELDCQNLELGDAHAGIGLVCGLDKK